MFGEFTDDVDLPAAGAAATQEPQTMEHVSSSQSQPEPLSRRIALHLAAHPDVVLKSQQRGEPEFTLEEKVAIAQELMQKNPHQFLYRFDRYLKMEHLAQFDGQAQSDPVMAHYLQEARNKLDRNKAKVVVRNRRWAAVQRLERAADSSSSRDCGDSDALLKHYFTEAEMKKRNPLLYQQLVGQHLTEEEKKEKLQDFDRSDCKISTIIFDHLDRCDERALQREQEEREDDMFEEEEDEEEEEEAEMEEPMEGTDPTQLDPTQKALLREEFVSSMYSAFVTGKDETFDYKCIDDNEDYDLLEIEGHDKEEQYFDEEEPCEVMSDNSSRNSPMLPQLCLDRRLKEGGPSLPAPTGAPTAAVAADDASSLQIDANQCLNKPNGLAVEDSMPEVESLSIK